MKKSQSIFKKIKSSMLGGAEPILKGINNYEMNIPDIEKIANERALACIGCENFIDEPIDFLKINDDRIEELSGKMCSHCGCALPYLLRQDIKICKKW